MESILSSPNQQPQVAVEGARESRHVAPAPDTAVMWEQMEYLMAHDGSSCHPGCPDCRRLEQLRYHLLKPFNSVYLSPRRPRFR